MQSKLSIHILAFKTNERRVPRAIHAMTIEIVEAAVVVQSTVIVIHRVADLVIVLSTTIGQLKPATILIEHEARHVVPLATETSLALQPSDPVSDILKTTIKVVSVDFWGIETVRGQRLAKRLTLSRKSNK